MGERTPSDPEQGDAMRLQKRYILIGGVVLAVLLALAAGLLFWGRRPFRGLEAADIAAASVL